MSLILTENMSFNEAKLIVEATGSDEAGRKKDLYMKGIFIQGGVKNHNQRVYPVEEIRRAVDSINEKIRAGYSICGEADHPEELNINLDRISHVITDMYMDGAAGMGKLKILPTPVGNIARTLLENDIKLGVSSRGQGNVNNFGEVENFEMITVDIVMNPSAPNAYPIPVYESLNSRRGVIMEDLARSVRNDERAQKFLQEEVLNWISKF
jgi:hypothetical protein